MKRSKGVRKNFFLQVNAGGRLDDFHDSHDSQKNSSLPKEKTDQNTKKDSLPQEKIDQHTRKDLHQSLSSGLDMSRWELVIETKVFGKVGLPQVTTNYPQSRIRDFFALLDTMLVAGDNPPYMFLFKLKTTKPPYYVDKTSFLEIVSYPDGKKLESISAILFLTMIPSSVKCAYPEFKNDYFSLIRMLLSSKGIGSVGIKALPEK